MNNLTGNVVNFALDIFKRFSKDENIFFSPLSISYALALTLAGCKDETKKQLKKAMGFEKINDKEIHNFFKQLNLSIFSIKNENFALHLANRLYNQKDFYIEENFLDVCKEFYQSLVMPMDFVNRTSESCQIINDHVDFLTEGKIKDLIKPEMVTSLTRLIIINAIYFKAAWDIPFHESSTNKENFRVSKNKKVKVDMMKISDSFYYAFHPTLHFQTVKLYYKEKLFSLIVLLPDLKLTSLSQLEDSLTPEILENINLEPKEVDLWLPKFKFSSTFSLKSELSNLGVKDLFDEEKANLKNISSKGKLSVSEVIHKAFIDVNEQGTEAAGATAVMVEMMCCDISMKPVVFRANHPFLFLIKEEKTSNILFMGRVVNPSA